MNETLRQRIEKIKLVISDVDGVLTSGELFYAHDGYVRRPFHVQDGYGLKLLMAGHIEVGVITAGSAETLKRRFDDLSIKHLYFSQRNKLDAYDNLLTKLNLTPEDTAYIGDDLPDLPLLERSAVGFTVANANAVVQEKADWISQRNGGAGAVREICDLILTTQNKLHGAFEVLQADER